MIGILLFFLTRAESFLSAPD